MNIRSATPQPSSLTRRPRIGFLGTGWIGRHRMEALIAADVADAVAVADAVPDNCAAALALAPGAVAANSLEDLLDENVDGVVIATPSALHAEQAIAALERGVAVFCQKPLGRTAAEAAAIVDAARAADRLLGVDLSYRYTQGMEAIRKAISEGEIGKVYTADLVFHNAYGPDKAWFYDPALSGGGCVMDLGIHLVDLALWVLDFPEVVSVSSELFAGGARIEGSPTQTEDYAIATVGLATGVTLRLGCSWKLSAGQDAVISASFYGTGGGLSFANRGGSFYDFSAEQFAGTSRRILAEPPDAWGGRAVLDWGRRLAGGEGFDPGIARIVEVAAVLDRIYRR